MTKKIVAIILSLFFVSSFPIYAFSSSSSSSNEDELFAEFDEFMNDCIPLQTYGTIYSSANQQREIFTNRLIVSTDNNTPLSEDCGASYKFEGLYNLHIFQYTSASATESAYNYFDELENVDCVEYDRALAIDLTDYCGEESEPDALLHSFEKASDFVKYTSAKSIIDSRIINKEQVVVAVIDTGVDASHSFFQMNDGSCRILPGIREFDNIPFASLEHGTHIAGIIVANTPDNVKILSLNFAYYDDHLNENMGFISNLIYEINFAVTHNAGIINLCLSKEINENSNSFALEQAIINATNNGVIVVAAAGNERDDVANYIPQCIETAITVSATNFQSSPWIALSGGTNYGSLVDISAPGENIYSAVPNNGYELLTGTSMAAPFVSAAAAILKTFIPSLTCSQVCQILKSTATIPTAWDSTKYGAGIVNFERMLSHSLVKLAKPSITLNSSGMYAISGPAGSNIYYTTDGSTPTENSTQYSAPFISPTGCKSIKAIAVLENMKSDVVVFQLQVYKDMEIKYKQTVKLEITPNASVRSIYSDNNGIVSISDPINATVYGAKRGNATVTVKLDAGRTYIFNITVKFSFWQWIQYVFLFGFLWM